MATRNRITLTPPKHWLLPADLPNWHAVRQSFAGFGACRIFAKEGHHGQR